MRRFLLLLLILSGCAWGQNTPTIGVLPDNGPNLPATCIIGQIYFRTATTIGLNQCNPANTWTALVAGSGGLPAHLSYSDPTLTVSAATFGSGQIALSGNTSGTATLTAPAVAGTTTNAIVSSNYINAPAFLQNTNNTGGFLSSAGTGLVQWINNSTLGITLNSTDSLRISAAGQLNLGTNLPLLAWSSGSPGTLGDTGLGRGGVGILLVNTGGANRSGLVLSGNSVFVTGNFTTAANTNLQTITGLSWTFPASAQNWNFHCHLSYSQGTANAAVAFGIQAATNNPTNIFANGVQQITAGPPATFVTGTLATLATTTATNIVSGTPGATGTNYTVDLGGTLELGASANTINIMVSTATSADAVTVLRGSYCSLAP